jgi:type II secretory ATPase GspE/PulE/Tfp pilus assembly ATPase PilB-like protein
MLNSLKLDFSDVKSPELFRAKGCPRCFNTGYSSRVGIAEVLLISPAVRDLILTHAQERLIKDQARKEGMRTLREEGLDAVMRGLTTLEEVLRVTAPDE